MAALIIQHTSARVVFDPPVRASHPDFDAWSGDEPDPYLYLEKCPYCGAEPSEDCQPWCHDDEDVEERE